MKAFEVKPDVSAETAAETENSHWTKLDGERHNSIKQHLHLMFVASIWLGWAIVVALGAIWLWHFVVPSKGWLPATSLDKIQWLFVGLVGSNLSQKFLQRRVK